MFCKILAKRSETEFLSFFFRSARTCSDSDEYTGIDDYLDEALEGDDVDGHRLNAHDQKDHNASGSVSSNSFSYERKMSEAPRQQVIAEDKQMESPIKSHVGSHPMDGENSESLTHSVGSYRRQQLKINTPEVRRAVFPDIDDSNASTDSDGSDDGNRAHDDYIQSQVELVAAKIKKLSQNHIIQQHQMVQASNALNICESTFAFAGSTESVVAEWKLLIASKSQN